MNGVQAVQEMGPHEYLVRLIEGGDVFEIRLHASHDVLTRISSTGTDERQIVEATVSYLIARQRADDLPGTLDLEDVAAAYDGYLDAIRDQVAQP